MINLGKVKYVTVKVNQRQNKRKANGGSKQCDHHSYIIEEGFLPNSLMAVVILIRSCDPSNLQDIILNSNLVPAYIVAALEVP